jgi:hypothetical protein
MMCRRTMMTRTIAALLALGCYAPSSLPAQDAGKKDIVVEMSVPQKAEGNLGTGGYPATAKEGPFLKKVTEKPVAFWSDLKIPRASNMSDEEWAKFQREMQKEKEKEKTTKIAEDKYVLAEQAGQYVGWFGILRESTTDEKAGVTTLLLEHKFFDGLVDLHQQIVSLYGAGDFSVTLRKQKTGVPPLALVRVYGKVAKDKNGAPTIAAEYVRVWNWGLFAFMDYGKDKSNPKWVELRKAGKDKAYSANPTTAYYEELLGKRE